MRTLRLALTGTAILALLGGVGGAVLAQSEPLDPSVRTDLLPGVSLTVEEVEPGVYRVIDDGVRDLAATLTRLMPTESPGLVAGHDGSLWVQGGTTVPTAFPLGGELTELPPGVEGPDFVTPDGRAWAVRYVYDGEGWTEAPMPPTRDPVEDHVAPDGGQWRKDDLDCDDWVCEPCPSVVRFDGVREDRFLVDACSDSIDIGPDGAVWALARTGSTDDPAWNLYVITSKAVTASE